MTSGVYAIVNTTTGRAYIGSSVDIKRRWLGHRSALNRERSSNKALQADWSLANGAGFELRILEETPADDRVMAEAEQRWLAHYDGRRYNARLQVWRSAYRHPYWPGKPCTYRGVQPGDLLEYAPEPVE